MKTPHLADDVATKKNHVRFKVDRARGGAFDMELQRAARGWYAQAHCPRCRSTFSCGEPQGTATHALLIARDGLDKHTAERPACPQVRQ